MRIRSIELRIALIVSLCLLALLSIIEINDMVMRMRSSEAMTVRDLTLHSMHIAIIVIATLAVTVFLAIVQRIIRPLEQLSSIVLQVSKGDFDFEPLNIRDPLVRRLHDHFMAGIQALREVTMSCRAMAEGEYGNASAIVRGEKDELAKAVNQLADTLRDIATQADAISRGNFETRIIPRSERDALGKALFEMTRQMHLATGRYQAFTESLGEWAFELDTNSVVTYSSEGVQSLLGYTTTEITGRAYRDLLGHANPGSTVELMRLALAEGAIISDLEVWMRRAGGDEIRIQINAKPYLDDAGEPMGHRGVGRDITDRRAAEEAIRTSEERFRGFYENAPIALLILAPDATVVDWNIRAETMFGYKREEAVGRNVFELIVPANTRPKVEDMVALLLQEEGGKSSVNDNITKNGGRIICEWSNSVLRGLDGSVTGILSLALDITERKIAALALEQQRRQLMSIFDGMGEPIYIADPDSYELLYVNEAFKKLWGDGAGRRCYELMHGLDKPCDFCTNPYIFGENAGKTYTWEIQNQRTGGWYRCIDRAIRWTDGSWVRFELAIEVTEQRIAEEALRRERNRFIEGPVVVFRWENKPNWPVTYVSPNVKKLLGYAPDDFINARVSYGGIIHPEDAGIVNASMEAHLSSDKEHIGQDYRVIRRDGEVIWVHEFTTDSPDDHGVITHYDGFVFDITERKHVEAEAARKAEELSRSNSELRALSEQNALQNWLKSGQAELNDQMRGVLEMHELMRNAITHLARILEARVGAIYLMKEDARLHLISGYAFTHRKNLASCFEIGEGLVGQAALEKEPILLTRVPSGYMPIASALGETTPGSILVQPLVYENDVKGVIELGTLGEFPASCLEFTRTVSQNIAVAIHTAQAREQQEALLKRAQRLTDDLQRERANLQRANQDLEAQTAALRDSESSLETQQEELRQVNEELQAQQEELRAANEELEHKANELSSQRDSVRNKNVELEKIRGDLEQKANDLAVTSKYKSEFLANMSHELRTPLNSLLILAQVLGENKDANLSEKQLRAVTTIHGAGTDLLNLINDILDLSKVEAGKMELHIEAVEIASIRHTLELHFNPLAERKKLSFSVSASSDIPMILRTDRQRLEQIIRNLLSNAFKFTEEGGVTVVFSRPGSGVDLSKSGLDYLNAIAITVADTGIGVPIEKRKIIFEAFQQADGTTSRRYGGTGLGLSISRELAKLLGGELRMDSVEGKGSTFVLYIPERLSEPIALEASPALQDNPPPRSAHQPSFTPESPTSPPAAPAEPEMDFVPDDRKNVQPGDKVLLIMEDDQAFAQTLLDVAHEQGFKALVAGDGSAGLHLADFHRPTAIILDITLPGMDGWGVIKRLKDNPETRHIPVHFISAMDEPRQALELGAIGYLRKPVTLDTLRSAFTRIEKLSARTTREMLLVEDDDTLRDSVMELIHGEDVSVTGASSGAECIKLLKEREFDCMVLDIGLPDMNGFELLETIKSDERLRSLPIIVYTGKELTPEENRVLEKYTRSIIIKSAQSPERLLDETTLFLHRVSADLPEDQRRILERSHEHEGVLKDKQILVVDDDMRNMFALTSYLEEKGLITLEAKDGYEGLRLLDEHPDLDLVLMDIMMPGMDGYQTIAEIRKQRRFEKLPIIALTAKAMRGDRFKCIEAGASDYLSKPVDGQKLMSMLRVWLYKG